ncbi:alpha/beta hydrolase [Kordiimonas pumila]|uniref:Alpha/beta hydrolase n=1 Tax=Kordiimonas pumila TaxID=2161677 RepID=A0ABV7D9G7_9PROT|nr:alpha/beta hydrolase [Kordiimonas pumila]
MPETGFNAFFKDVMGPMLAPAPLNMKIIPAPAAASAETKLLLENVKGPRDSVDIRDEAVRAAFRQGIMAVWKAAASYLGIEHTFRTEEIGGVSCRIFTPNKLRNKTQKLLYLHGGSYWLGSAEANASIAISMADKSGLEVISIDYRLAPEHPFPAAQNDAVAVIRALQESGTAHTHLALFGDSAGGGLALSTMLALRDQNIPMPAALGLISPWTDMTFSGDSHQTCNHYTDPWLSVEGLIEPAALYAGEHPLTHPYISPLFADLTGLPPTLIHVGTREILMSDSTRLARAAKKAGVPVELAVFEAMWHVWHFYPRVPEADEAIDEMSQFLCNQLASL